MVSTSFCACSRDTPPASAISKNLPCRTSAIDEYPRPLSAERTVWPCGSRTVDFSETNTRAFMGSSIIALSAIVSAMTLEERLRAHRRKVMFALLALSIAVRAVYYAELSRGPCLWTHRWTESDNAFFDRWAKDIAGGDWLTDQALHPMVSWNYAIAKMHFTRHPEEAATGDEAARATALWDRWYGGKTFHQEPLYAYSIALTYQLFGEDVRWVFLWQMALGVLVNLMLWDLARRYFGETAGALTAVMVIFFAPLYYLELTLVRTTLLTFLAVAMLYQSERALEKKS